MNISMTVGTKCNQVLGYVSSSMGTKLLMMDMQVSHRSAMLAAPAIALHDLLAN